MISSMKRLRFSGEGRCRVALLGQEGHWGGILAEEKDNFEMSKFSKLFGTLRLNNKIMSSFILHAALIIIISRRKYNRRFIVACITRIILICDYLQINTQIRRGDIIYLTVFEVFLWWNRSSAGSNTNTDR